MAAHKIEDKPKVNSADEPSAEWGWHGESPKFIHITGWLIAITLLAMIIGNHHGQVENIYLVLTAASIIGFLVWDVRRRKTSWRR